MKKTKGRQRIPMEKMEKQSNLQVTFSKRRSGLFKKASELCILTGAEVALVVFSPGKKVYSFGHPFVDTTINRFLGQNPPILDPDSNQLIEFQRDANVRDLNAQLEHVLNQLEMEKKRSEELDNAMGARQRQNWWEAPVEHLTVEQLQILKTALDSLKKDVEKETEVQMVKALNPLPYYAGMGVPSGIRSLDAGEGSSLNPFGYSFGYGP
ncbi:Transcription factor, MADS-box [Dillenia turbinata]|uniref:Transcription factor, MADS-box n=1 Tax=Dillenia turbinata TaxID=194707 RepID=A0AAN8UT67_9MAGN